MTPSALSRDLALSLVAEAAARLAQLVVVALASRELGPEAFGLVVLGWSFVALALPIAQVAPETLGLRLIAEGAARAPVIKAILRFKLAVAGLGLSLAVICALTAPWLDGTKFQPALVQIAWAQIGLLAAGLSTLWALRGDMRGGVAGVIRIGQSVVLVTASYALLAIHAEPASIAWAEIIAGLFGAALSFLCLRSAGAASRGQAALPSVRLILVNAQGATLATALWYAPLILVSWRLAPADFGVLGGVWRLVIALFSVGLVIYQVFHPLLVRAYRDDRARAQAMAAYLALLAMIGGGLAVLTLISLSGPLTKILFGAAFADADTLFALLVVTLWPAWLGSTYGYALLSAGEEAAYAKASGFGLIAALVAVGFAMILNPSAQAMAAMIPAMVIYLGVQAGLATRLGLTGFAALGQAARAPFNLDWLSAAAWQKRAPPQP